MSVRERLLQVLPFIIALSYMAAFSVIDRYPYALSSPDDQGLFQRIAMNLLNRGAFSGSLTGQAVFCSTRPPLYPFILAFTWKVSGSTSLLPIRLIQGICYLLTLYLISKISTMVAGDRKYGLFSALFASIVPFAAAATNVILTESLTLFFLTMAVFLAVRFRTGAGRATLVALGASLGLLVLQRPTFMLIPALFLGYVLFSRKIKKKDIIPVVLLVTLPLTTVVAPWSMYARSETGSWSPVRAGVGFNLMQGILINNPSLLEDVLPHLREDVTDSADMSKRVDSLLLSRNEFLIHGDDFVPDISRLTGFCLATYISAWHPQPPAPRVINKCDQFLKKAALAWVKHHPFGFMRTIGANVGTLLSGDFQPLVYQRAGSDFLLYTVVLRWALYLSFVLGTILLLRRRRFHVVFFPLVIVFYIIIVHSSMHTEPRYFIYAYTFMPMSIPVLLPGYSFRDKSGSGRRDNLE
jgi:4-amino-4-deoxy-L-arabinose transferase-like glycosyltransferase